jgi:integrase/recombinase XerD
MKNKRVSPEPEGFLDFLNSIKRLSPKTLEAYGHDLRWWESLGFDLNHSEAPSEEKIMELLEILQTQDFESATRSRRRSSLRSFARYRATAFLDWNRVLESVPGADASQDLPKALSTDEIKRLLHFEAGDSPEGLRNKTLLEVLYACGLRISEALGLSWDDIDFQQNLLRVCGKGSKERVLPFSPRAAAWLQRWKDHPGDWKKKAPTRYKNVVFLSSWGKPLSRMGAWKILHKRGLECGIEGLHPHILRHSLATHLIQGGADVRMVQKLLGHESLNTTSKYLKISDGELQSLFAEIHPLR